MKLKYLLTLVTCLTALPLAAQVNAEVDLLKQQLQTVKDAFEKAQAESRRQIEELTKRLDAVAQQQSATTNEQQKWRDWMNSPVTPGRTPLPGERTWSAADPIRLAGGGAASYLNISFAALVAAGGSTAKNIEALQLGGHDPKQRGFTVQNLELTLDGKVDPYFRGQANIILQIDSAGETVIEAEEAFLETVSLPWNLQVKAGQFFTEFGRLNSMHPHTWDFVDQPLINGRFLGGDGLRNPGVRLSWLVPTPFYSELFLAVQNSQGETATSFRNDHEGEPFLGRLHDSGSVKAFNDMLFAPRYVASFNLSDAQTLMVGASAAFGPNGSGPRADTQIYGLDFFWKWKPAHQHGGFPFVTWQTELMMRRYQAGAFTEDLDGDGTLGATDADLNGDGLLNSVPREMLTDYGVYSQIAYGFQKGWVAGLRADFVTRSRRAAYEAVYGNDPDRDQRWRISPNLTWYPSEFSKVRLQYNYDRRSHIGADHSIWLQFEFLLGAHAAHKF